MGRCLAYLSGTVCLCHMVRRSQLLVKSLRGRGLGVCREVELKQGC